MSPLFPRNFGAIAFALFLIVPACGRGSGDDVDAAANAQHLEDDRAAAEAKEANAKAVAQNADTLTALRKDVEATERKITYFEEKASKAGSDPRAVTAAAAVHAKDAAVKADLDAMENDHASPAAFDAARARYEVDKASLEAEVRAFGDLLKK